MNRKKSWSIYKFVSLANKVASQIKFLYFLLRKIKVTLLKKLKTKFLLQFSEIHSNLSCPALVTALSSRLNSAISIDNGIMHMIALAKIPMVVLFGPTNSEKFAPKNKLIKIIDSKKNYKTNDINSITVDEVFSLI